MFLGSVSLGGVLSWVCFVLVVVGLGDIIMSPFLCWLGTGVCCVFSSGVGFCGKMGCWYFYERSSVVKRLSVEVDEPEDTLWDTVMDSLCSDHPVVVGMMLFTLISGIGTFAVVNGLSSGDIGWYVGAGILCLVIASVFCVLMAVYGIASLSDIIFASGLTCFLSGLLSVVVGIYIHLAL